MASLMASLMAALMASLMASLITVDGTPLPERKPNHD
jgi:hypothetical protein